MKSILFKPRSRSNMGYSLIEVIGIVAILGILAAVALSKFTTTKSAVVDTKLLSEVTKLNTMVTVYQASGGSLAEAVTPQDVIDKLKTVRGAVDAKKTVGPMTGRAVDVRLVAHMQTEDEAASGAARVIWNPGTQKFEITHGGAAGAASFVLNNALADNGHGIDTRAPTNVTYNEEAGWVWKNDNTQGLPFLSPLNATVNSSSGYAYNPITPDGGASAIIAPQLPPPAITPRGGSYLLANFVSTVTISSGLLVPGSGVPNYMVIHEDGSSEGWMPYSAPITITYGDKVMARNATTDAALHTDSATTSETYVLIPTLLTAPRITPNGGSFLASAWPGITIDANGSPVGPYTAISYKITSASGASGPWTTYTGPLATTYGDTVTAKNVSLNAKFYTDSATVAKTFNVTGSSKLPPPLFVQSTDSTGKKWITINTDPSVMPIPAGVRIYYTTDGSDPGVNSSENPLTNKYGQTIAKLYTPGSPVAVPTSGPGAQFFEVTARLYPPTSNKINFDASDMADYHIGTFPGLFSGTILANWNPSTGPSGMVTTRINTDPNEVIEKNGTPSGSNGGQNIFTFERKPSFTGINANTAFRIGTITYKNGTISSGTGATGLSLNLQFILKAPFIATIDTTVTMLLNNTPNSGGGYNSQSADACTLVNPVTNFLIQHAGLTYTMTLKYGDIDISKGYVSGNTLNVWEGANGDVDILATFVAQ